MVSKLLATALMMAVCFQGIASVHYVHKSNVERNCLAVEADVFPGNKFGFGFRWEKAGEEKSEIVFVDTNTQNDVFKVLNKKGEPNGKTLEPTIKKSIDIITIKDKDGKIEKQYCLTTSKKLNDKQQKDLDKACKELKFTIDQSKC